MSTASVRLSCQQQPGSQTAHCMCCLEVPAVCLMLQGSEVVGQRGLAKHKTVLGTGLKKDPVVNVLYQQSNG